MSSEKDRRVPPSRLAYPALHDELGETPAEFTTAGELAVLMAALPPNTPVSVAETVRLDPALQLVVTPNRTVSAAAAINVVEDNGDENGRFTPGVELCAYIVGQNAPVPAETVAFPQYERAVEAMQDGDFDVVLGEHMELLTWVANTLADTPADQDETVPKRISDVDLRERLNVEAERLRHCVARLGSLRARMAVRATRKQWRMASPRDQGTIGHAGAGWWLDGRILDR